MNRRLKRPLQEPQVRVKKPRTLKGEWKNLDGRTSDIATQMRELESFIAGIPHLQQERLLNSINLVPPPDFDYAGGGEHFREARRLSYGRQQRLQQIRNRNLALFLLLLATVIAAAIAIF